MFSSRSNNLKTDSWGQVVIPENKRICKNLKVLRTPGEPVSFQEGVEIAQYLKNTLEKHNKWAKRNAGVCGIGLAAPQLSLAKQVCIIKLPGLYRAFINPHITQFSQSKFPHEEGCLSLDYTKTVWRHFWVDVCSDGKDGTKIVERFGVSDADGLMMNYDLLASACVQHEISHCFGMLIDDFTDKNCLDPDEWVSKKV